MRRVVFLRLGGQEFSSLRREKELGELSGGSLTADLGEFAGVVAAEEAEFSKFISSSF